MATIATKQAATWQEELAAECKKRSYTDPVYNIISDRRGGRTAWSSTVTVNSQNIAARYWYDGQYLNNAKEDCAEVACTRLRNPSMKVPTMVRAAARGFEEGAAGEEEKIEPEEEPMPEGAIARVGEDNFD